MICHILVWQAQVFQFQTQQHQFILQETMPFFKLAIHYLMTVQIDKNIPQSSQFFSQLLTYINRIIIQNPGIILEICENKENFSVFVVEWMQKMDNIITQEFRKINLIAIYHLIPYFSADLLNQNLNDIGKLTFA